MVIKFLCIHVYSHVFHLITTCAQKATYQCRTIIVNSNCPYFLHTLVFKLWYTCRHQGMHRDYNNKQVLFPLFYLTLFFDSYSTTVHSYINLSFITEAFSGVCTIMRLNYEWFTEYSIGQNPKRWASVDLFWVESDNIKDTAYPGGSPKSPDDSHNP